jgi:hypothetical protein
LLNPCAQVFVRNNTSSVVVDAFTYPYLTAAYGKRINTSSLCTLTILNRNTTNNPARKQVLVYDMGVFIGIVGSRGKLKSKAILNVKQGNNILVTDLAGNPLNGAGTTMGCPTDLPVT